MQVGFISLGCSKNLVDSEMILGLLQSNHFQVVHDMGKADLIFINTCGFIQSAKEEAIATIFDVLKQKKKEADVFVVGCFSQRYFEVLQQEIPEVAQFIKIDDYAQIGTIINEHYQKPLIQEQGISFLKRAFATPVHVGYVRIADGCNNRCSYCAIPLIRGSYRSRLIPDIVEEVKLHIASGHVEINLISQDTTSYGCDIQQNLVELLKELVKIKGIHLLRLLYLYPADISDELIAFIQAHPLIAPYFDMPIQHGSNRILSKMYRRDTKESILLLVSKIRQALPHAILRTTIIVGFPGEQENDFEDLLDVIKIAEFDRLGAFRYSSEEDTPAALLSEQVLEEEKEKRYHIVMKTQQKIAHKRSKKRIGDKQEAYIEGYDAKLKKYKARDYSYAPDNIDGFIYVTSMQTHQVGEIVKVEIEDAYVYDLIGRVIKD